MADHMWPQALRRTGTDGESVLPLRPRMIGSLRAQSAVSRAEIGSGACVGGWYTSVEMSDVMCGY